jgi:hypothetical protein
MLSSRCVVRTLSKNTEKAHGPDPSRCYNPELQKALWEAKAVIFVYTTTDNDWGYCMWECGVATTPGSPDTRIIGFSVRTTSPAYTLVTFMLTFERSLA